MAVGGAAPVAYYPFACCPNPPVESPAFRYLVNAALLMWEIQTLPFDRGFAVLEREIHRPPRAVATFRTAGFFLMRPLQRLTELPSPPSICWPITAMAR